MAEVVRELQHEHASVEATLLAITEGAVANVPGVDYAGVTLLTKRRAENRAATDERVAKLDAVQTELDQGPCLDAMRDNHTVIVADMSTEQRWPRFAAMAVELGVQSSISFRLFINHDTLGSLNLYASVPRVFVDDAEQIGVIFATHAAIALVGAQHEATIGLALNSRDLIGQAKGIVMATYDLDAVRAFAVLTRLSQRTNTRLATVAKQISDTRRLPNAT
jgi:GAF domain-containing protein